jgi:hypothetical protein
VRAASGENGAPENFLQKQAEQAVDVQFAAHGAAPQKRPPAMPGWRLSERCSKCTMEAVFMSHHRGGNR